MQIIFRLTEQAGFPPRKLNMVNGAKDAAGRPCSTDPAGARNHAFCWSIQRGEVRLQPRGGQRCAKRVQAQAGPRIREIASCPMPRREMAAAIGRRFSFLRVRRATLSGGFQGGDGGRMARNDFA